MKKIITIVICLISISASIAQVPFNTTAPKNTPPISIDGVWEWDAAASGNNKMIAKFLNISTINKETTIQATLTPDDVKNTYRNWTLGKAREYTEATWYSNNEFYEVEAGGFTTKDKNGEVIARKRYTLKIFQPSGTPDYIVNGVLEEYSWKKSNSPKVVTTGGTEVVLQGVWINKKKKEASEQKNTAIDSKYLFTPEKIKNLLAVKTIELKDTRIVNKFNKLIALKPASNYTFSIDKLEALAVDDDCDVKGKAEFTMNVDVDVINDNGSYRVGYFGNIIICHASATSSSIEGRYEYPIGGGLSLNQQFVLNHKEYDFTVPVKDFNSCNINFIGSIQEVSMCGSASWPYTNIVDMNTPNKKIYLSTMQLGSNTVDFSDKDGSKKLRMYYTIKPQ